MADRLKDLAALLAGALFTLSLSPFNAWPVALVVPGLLFSLVQPSLQPSPERSLEPSFKKQGKQGAVRQVLVRFYLFNVGLFAAGASWIYVSIHVYGNASPVLATFLVAAFVLAYSLVCLPQAWLTARCLKLSVPAGVLGFTGLWVLQEWFRSWFLTGFPWLFQGYGLLESPLAGIVPVLGVSGLSLLGVWLSVVLATSLLTRDWRWLAGLLVVVPVMLLEPDAWTEPGDRVSVSLVQGNINQHTKWYRENRPAIFNTYRQASTEEWGRDLVIWPEASLTYFREEATQLLDFLDEQAGSAGSSLLLGIPDRGETGGFQNTVIMVGEGEGQYIKRRLVPFGEYVPLEQVLRGVIDFFDLPMSRNRSGPAIQDPLMAGPLTLSVSICYEVVYPELVRTTVHDPDLLVTVSNDTWFGESIGPWQHLQMARMRALENGRPMARGTNNGVTALIDHRGQLIASLPQFEAGVLRGELQTRKGLTPYHRWGIYPVLAIALLLLLPVLISLRGFPARS